MIRQHYGIVVDSEKPSTGVFLTNTLEFIFDENFIDLDFDNHCRVCRKRHHDDCYEADGSQVELVGFKKIKGGVNRGKWRPDPKSEYSAILQENILQVVKSKWGIRGALCSPCYPGQVDGNTKGDFLAYAPPPDVVNSDERDHLRTRIFQIKTRRH